MLTEMKIKTMIKELEKNNKEISKIRESIDDFFLKKQAYKVCIRFIFFLPLSFTGCILISVFQVLKIF